MSRPPPLAKSSGFFALLNRCRQVNRLIYLHSICVAGQKWRASNCQVPLPFLFAQLGAFRFVSTRRDVLSTADRDTRRSNLNRKHALKAVVCRVGGCRAIVDCSRRLFGPARKVSRRLLAVACSKPLGRRNLFVFRHSHCRQWLRRRRWRRRRQFDSPSQPPPPNRSN